ncbi:MAG: hypothetical protein RJA55_2167 [Acidobacteriota bacterium]
MTRTTLIRKRRRQSGFVLSTELLLVTTILAVGLISGLTSLRDNVISELSDTGDAIGSISQSFTYLGTQWTTTGGNNIAATSSFGFTDAADNAANMVGGDTNYVVYAGAASTTTSTSATSTEGTLTY